MLSQKGQVIASRPLDRHGPDTASPADATRYVICQVAPHEIKKGRCQAVFLIEVFKGVGDASGVLNRRVNSLLRKRRGKSLAVDGRELPCPIPMQRFDSGAVRGREREVAMASELDLLSRHLDCVVLDIRLEARNSDIFLREARACSVSAAAAESDIAASSLGDPPRLEQAVATTGTKANFTRAPRTHPPWTLRGFEAHPPR
jgi:hypothetical protein